MLRDAGIKVTEGILSDQVSQFLSPYLNNHP